MLIEALVPWPSSGVGCFDPMAVLIRMQEVFGPDLEYDPADQSAIRYVKAIQTAAKLGKPADWLPVLSAARVVQAEGPRHEFRLRVGAETFVTGGVDRYSVRVMCGGEAEFPEPSRGRFVAFLRSLRLGQVRVGVYREPN